MSLTCYLNNDKSFYDLLKTIAKKLYNEDSQGAHSITIDDIIHSIYIPTVGNDIDREQIEIEINTYEELIKKASEGYWDIVKMETTLSKLSSESSDTHKVIMSFWTNERERIHSIIINKSRWNNSLKDLSWRVDIKTVTKSNIDVNEPLLLFEFVTKDGHNKSSYNISGHASGSNSVKFGMDRLQVNNMISKLDEIQKCIDESSY